MGTLNMSDQINSKIIIVGDGGCGKTCLLDRVVAKIIDWDKPVYEPTTFANTNVTWDQTNDDGTIRSVDVELWDTAGQEGFEELRCMSYPGTSVYIIAYACNSQMSLSNVQNKWLPEIQTEINKQIEESGATDDPDVWFLLVGTKLDLRKE